MINKYKLCNAIFGRFDEDKKFIPALKIPKEEEINDSLKLLNEKEKFVIERRFNLLNPLTLAETGKLIFGEVSKQYGVSGERIRQIEGLSLRRLRHYFSKNSEFKKYRRINP